MHPGIHFEWQGLVVTNDWFFSHCRGVWFARCVSERLKFGKWRPLRVSESATDLQRLAVRKVPFFCPASDTSEWAPHSETSLRAILRERLKNH